MTVDQTTLIHQCACILSREPTDDDVFAVFEALRLMVKDSLITDDTIDAEYESLVNEHKLKGCI